MDLARARSFLLLPLAIALVPMLAGRAAAQQPPTKPQAKVYRDENGVPHIEADTEEVAWYAMGYEQARDGLYLIQAQVKRHRGQAWKHLDPRDADPNKRSDFIVKVLGIDQMSSWNHTQVRRNRSGGVIVDRADDTLVR